jgi:hypothetical protein
MRYPGIVLFLIGSVAAGPMFAQNTAPWKFAISGDSRNCGDIVMPAIAQGVRQSGAEFYWHLGDFRAIFKFDEDMVPPPLAGVTPKTMGISDYLSSAWPDFITHQLGPFGNLPVFLAIGNHELVPPMNRAEYLAQFADWLDAPVLREQRLKDDPADHKLKTYYHWVRGNVDFITLDNVSPEQMDAAQLRWVQALIRRDESSAQIQTIVVGMHEAFPDSLSEGHSMAESGQGERSGRQVYEALWHAQDSAHKHVYVFASHSHFYLEDVYRTDAWKGKVLPGWIVGTAGAQSYVLPPGVAPGPGARTPVYGYLMATVAADGSISTAFQEVKREDLLKANPGVAEPLVRWCVTGNHQ